MTFNSAVGHYTYPLGSAARPHAVTQITSAANGGGSLIRSFIYDANGNMTSDGTRALTYDGENRPIDVSGVQYAYGPDGKRLKKIATNGVLTLYLGADVERKQAV